MKEIENVKKDKTQLIKKGALYGMITTLIISATIACFSIIVGKWTDIATKALFLTISSWIHSMIILGIVSSISDNKDEDALKNIPTCTLLCVAILSFITTIFNIFNIAVFHFWTTLIYFWFIAVLLASLWITQLAVYGRDRDTKTHAAAIISAIFVAALAFGFLPNVFVDMPQEYSRFIIVCCILASTTSILTVIFGHLYTVQHPEILAAKKAELDEKNAALLQNANGGTAYPTKKTSASMVILIIIVCIPFAIFMFPWLFTLFTLFIKSFVLHY